MNDWGFNPSTFQAVGGIATAVALLGVILSSWIGIKSEQRSSRESALRGRPWISVVGTIFEGSGTLEPTWLRIGVTVQNLGILPSEQTTITLYVEPSPKLEEPSQNDHSQQPPFKMIDGDLMGPLFPNQTSNASWGFTEDDPFLKLYAQNVNLRLYGTIRYCMGQQIFETEFDSSLDSQNTTGSFRNLRFS